MTAADHAVKSVHGTLVMAEAHARTRLADPRPFQLHSQPERFSVAGSGLGFSLRLVFVGSARSLSLCARHVPSLFALCFRSAAALIVFQLSRFMTLLSWRLLAACLTIAHPFPTSACGVFLPTRHTAVGTRLLGALLLAGRPQEPRRLHEQVRHAGGRGAARDCRDGGETRILTHVWSSQDGASRSPRALALLL
eukprot:3396684-Pleurochrysis_carterae.AAC.1